MERFAVRALHISASSSSTGRSDRVLSTTHTATFLHIAHVCIEYYRMYCMQFFVLRCLIQ